MSHPSRTLTRIPNRRKPDLHREGDVVAALATAKPALAGLTSVVQAAFRAADRLYLDVNDEDE